MPGSRLKNRRNKEQKDNYAECCKNYSRTYPVIFNLNNVFHRDGQFTVLNNNRGERFRVNMDLTAFPDHFGIKNHPREPVSGFCDRLYDPGAVAGMEKIEVLPVWHTY